MNIDYLMLLKSFIVGGLICVVGQILIDKTKLTPARILVIYVTAGVVLGGLGLYQHLVNFAGCGATVPLTGFGNNLANGVIEEVKTHGLLGAFTGGVKASAGGIATAVFFRIYCISFSKTKNKETIILQKNTQIVKIFSNNLGIFLFKLKIYLCFEIIQLLVFLLF